MTNAVEDNSARSRFEMQVDGHTAFINYLLNGKLRVLTHSEVPPELRGAGIAGRLTAGALELVRARGEKVVPRCSYVHQYIEKNPQYQDLLAP